MKRINISFDNTTKKISDKLYGIFLEDINFACDGGLNANLVNNYSFDGVYLDPKTKREVPDYLRYWQFENCTAESGTADPLSENSRYARINTIKNKSNALVRNLGYNGNMSEKDSPAMSVVKGRTYEFSCHARGSFAGVISVALADLNGNKLTEELRFEPEEKWKKFGGTVKGIGTAYGALEIRLEGEGYIDIDLVSFMDTDHWNSSDPKWTGGRFRRDMVEALAELKPRFMRFPGGCIVEGRTRGNEYDWKDTVGRLQDRRSKSSLWGEKVTDGGYNQSYQIGFYEYFCLCEDLGMKPLPVLPAGICCQFRTMQWLPVKSEDFRYEVQNYLDLIQFATGDPEKNEWAALRAEMGHPEPFELEMIGVGNENFGPHYNNRFQVIENAVHEAYPDMQLVYAAGGTPIKPVIRPMWRFAKKNNPIGYLDEHSYNPPEWFINNANRYDDYERGTTKVYIGEYAANGMVLMKTAPAEDANRYCSALAEAAFLTGVERNGDVVGMTSYAPLFNLVSGTNWYHNLIDFCPSGISKTPNYLVQQMFGANYGDQYIAPVAELPEGVFASATTDGRTKWLKIVNINEESYQISIPADGTKARCELLTADPDAQNTLTFSGEVSENVSVQKYDAEVKDHAVNVTQPGRSVQLIVLE